MAAFVGFAYFILLWHYKGQSRSSIHEIIKSAQQQIESSYKKVRSAFIDEEVSVQKELSEKE